MSGSSPGLGVQVCWNTHGGFLDAAGCMLTGCQKHLNLLKFASIFQRPATVNESTNRLCPRFDG